jgi:hypothetical protein
LSSDEPLPPWEKKALIPLEQLKMQRGILMSEKIDPRIFFWSDTPLAGLGIQY